jgi:DNA-binding NarL/FixJ family response regulator
MRIRVLVADDFPLFLDGVCAALEADRAFAVVARAADGAEAAERAAETGPDVVLLDMMMPRCGGGEAIGLVRERAPGARVLAISASERIDVMQEAFEAGASGYVTKFARPRELREALIEVYSGGRVVSPALARRVLQPDGGKTPADPARGVPGLLSERESAVLRLVAEGRADAEVAAKLSVRVRTVQSHLARVRAKTGVRRRSELVTWAMRHGVL